MSESLVNQALIVSRPKAQGSWHFAHATTAVTYYVPPEWRGKHITIASSTSDLYIVFGDQGVDLKASGYSAATAVGASEPKYISAYWNAGEPVLAGTYRDFYVEPTDTFFCVVSSAASGYFYISTSAQPNGEYMPPNLQAGNYTLFLDPSYFPSVTLSGTDITALQNRGPNKWSFSESTNMPAYTAGSAETLVNGRPNAAFTAGNSDKLVCNDTGCADMFSGTNAFTLFLGFSRGATGAAHTLFSAGTTATDNGRWDITLDASDDVVITRISSAGGSTQSTYTATIAGAPTSHCFCYVYDGNGGNTLYVDRALVSLTGSATGDLGTLTRVAVGCRSYNTSTHNQFATGKMTSVLAYPRALTASEISKVHEWYIYRLGL